WISVYVSNTPPLLAHAPMEMHHLGSGICSQMRCSTGIIFSEMRPDTMSRSDCRGENLSTSEPKREASYFDMKVAIISMPQQAVPKGMGHIELDRAQLMAKPSWVVMTSLILSGKLIRYSHSSAPERRMYARPSPSTAMNTSTACKAPDPIR